MLLISWLTKLRYQFTASRISRCRKITSFASNIEPLDSRQLLSAAPAVAIGSETRVNTTTTGDQSAPAVAMDGSGDYVVVWQSADASGLGIFGQRYSRYGVTEGSEFPVNSITAGDQSQPTVAIDSSGAFVVAWSSSDGSGLGVYARRFDASGVAQGADFRINTYTTNDQQSPSVAMDANGNFVVGWQSTNQGRVSPYGDVADIEAQRYDSTGTKVGSEFRVNVQTTSNEHSPSVSMNASGEFAFAWVSQDFNNFIDPFPHISAERYAANGTVTTSEYEMGFGYHGQKDPQVAIDSTGDFVSTFWGYQNDVMDSPIEGGVRAAVSTDTNNNIAVNTFQTGTQSFPSVAAGGNGDFVITWESQNQDGSGDGIYRQEYDSSLNPVGGEMRVNAITTGGQGAPAVAADANGDYVIVFQSDGQDGSGQGIYSQQFFAAATSQGPMLLQIEGNPIIASGMLSIPLTSTLNVYDAQASTWTGATVQITSNYQNGQDVLSFTNTAKITGQFDASTGKLTLTGTDSVSNYRAALRSITYHNTSATPNTLLTRTISVQAMDAISSSNILTRDLVVHAASGPPTVTGLSSNQTYISPTAPLAIAPNVVVTDPDNLNILSATVSFTSWQGEDRVAFSNTLGLQHTFAQNLNAHTATLTITGSATAAQYQTLLRTVTYQDVASTPMTSPTRVATITVNDPSHSGSATTNISVVRYVSGLATTVNYNQGSSPVSLAPNLVLQPPPGVSHITSATVSFTNWQGEDRVAFTNTLGLSHGFSQDLNAHTATLTIMGSATVAQYQALLRTVTYQDVAGAPVTTTRTARFSVNDGTNSASATENVTVTKVNRPPVVQVNDSTQLTYKVNSTSIAIMSMALITDPDSANLKSLTVQISSGYQSGHDVFGYGQVSGITASFNATTGTLTFSGVSSVSNYRAALRSVTFHTVGSGVSTATRVFKVIATDTTNTSSTPVTRSLTVTQ